MEYSFDEMCVAVESIKKICYVCSKCGEIIFPDITQNDDGTINTSIEKSQIRGGLGNKVVKDNICNNCLEKSRFDISPKMDKIRKDLAEMIK